MPYFVEKLRRGEFQNEKNCKKTGLELKVIAK